tara:strand:- start:16583 stop:17296 length:714 start_codon:yes stop_codon:yes gene_type:complete
MPEVIEEPEQINDESLTNPETGEDNENFIYEEEADLMPEIVAKIPQIKKEDIFLREGEKEVEPKPKRKKRPPMSDEHKAKLAEARVKALATRRKNSLEKKEMKELEKKKKQMEKQNLIDFVEGKTKKEVIVDPEPPKVMRVKEQDREIKEPERAPVPSISVPSPKREYITKEELEESNLQAIMKYEALRKKRKEEKKVLETIQKEEEVVRQKIKRALPDTKAYYGRELPNDYFKNCF